MAQLSRLKLGLPRRRLVEGGVDIVGPGLGRLHRQARAGGAPPAAPSVTVVLPAPERGAATMRPGRGHGLLLP